MKKSIPNLLTLARLILTVVFLAMVLYSPYVEPVSVFLDCAFVLFFIAAVTDVVDGYLARRFNVTSKFGRIVDPLVDKILVCGAFVCFALIGEPKLFSWSETTLHFIHWSVVGILILREAYVTLIRHWAEAKGIDFAAAVSGKVKTFVQIFAVGTVVVKMAHVPIAQWGYWFTLIVFGILIVVTAYSGIDYDIRWRRSRH